MSAPRVVAEGDEIVVRVEGGFVRRRAPGPGLVFPHDTGDVFVALTDVAALVDAAREMPAKKRSTR